MISAETRRKVMERAGDRCEYCRMPSAGLASRLQVDHVRPRQHGGSDDLDNLAAACDRCNNQRGPNLSGFDPETDLITPLFDPRVQAWDEHFAVVGLEVVGLSPEGRATVHLLEMNRQHYVTMRRLLVAIDMWP
ncbi:MAG: HNH endonuclease signature motif containing protein [Planctomycetota bacterium]